MKIQNIFTVKPFAKPDLLKSVAKASIATKYIGYGGGSTGQYRADAKCYANTKNYTKNDVIFLSVNGNVSDINLEKTKQELNIAIKVENTIIKDNETYLKASTYNKGERLISTYLLEKKYCYSEITIQNQVLGVWKPKKI